MPRRRVIGFDAGGTKLLGGVVDEHLVVHHRVRRLLRGITDRAAVIDVITEAVEEARAAAPDVVAAGFGIPALVDRERGVAVSSVHLPLAGLAFGDLVSERIGLPVTWDNDTNVAMLAEHRAGAARGATDAVMLTLGTGIGGAIVSGGELRRGAVGAGGELGHMVVDLDGPPCQGNCPNRGCLEAIASGSAIGRAGAALAESDPGSALGRALADGVEVTGGLVTELAHDGDPGAIEVLSGVGRLLGVGLANIVNVFNPTVIVIGGGAARSGDLLLGPARAEMAVRALTPSREMASVVPAHFGDEAGMLGAAMMALDAVAAADGGGRAA